ncbi:MAG: gliding motility-associated C-terminal domain-containing protein [Chitinophagales bacterium]
MDSKKAGILLSIFFILSIKLSFATHYKAGEMEYEYLGPQTYRVTVITYTETAGSSALADQDTITLDWGDGTTDVIGRVNGPLNGNGFPDGEILSGTIKKNIYISAPHTYPGALPYYIISVTELNRTENIINIANGTGSVNVPIFLEDTLKYVPPELFEGNSSPTLLNPPIDYANTLDTFYHNPNAFDVDGDSLHYSLVPSLQATGVPVPQYLFPDQIQPGADNNISINALTGELIWAVPQQIGDYNVAIRIREFRNGQCIGVMLRDMQILVDDQNNDPPQIRQIKDTCVYAGDTLNINIRATDPNIGDVVNITAAGGPIEIDPFRVSFTSTDGNPATANFQWQTNCADIRPTFYEIVFKAEDDYTTIGGVPRPLVDLETWIVHVIPPPPDSLFATVTNNDVQLNWDNPYECFSDPDFQYFSVWRKYGCENMDRLGCETGLANSGYELIADNITTYNYLDLDLDRGHIYSYRILAHFGTSPQSSSGSVFNVQESVPSHEVCIELPLDFPVITNVSVTSTSTTDGSMFIQWSKPKAGSDLLDTIQDAAPYVFELYRSEGFTGANLSLIQTFTAPSFTAFNDTFFNDSLLNTMEKPYSYQVKFYSDNGAEELGETSIASSVYLEVQSSDKSLILNWEENVPWVNDTFTIFRFNQTTLVFDSINITEEHTYKDEPLENDSTYCYLIQSKGKYFSSGLINPIINFSQENCGTPRDTTAPCAPDVIITNDCDLDENIVWNSDNFQNRLSWTTRNNCGEDIVFYSVYFEGIGEVGFQKLIETPDTFYVHQLVTAIAGCYYVTGTDASGNESLDFDTLCIENCARYILPNVFTPNGDGDNDFFTPFPDWRFVESIDMKIYNRWGNFVFETKNPEILWNGNDVSGQALKDGIYIYNGFYFVRKLDGSLEKIVLPPNKRGGGFVHLMRGK